MEDLLEARLADGIRRGRKAPVVLGFLTEEDAQRCRDKLARERECRFSFWGGYQEAERTLLCLYPDYQEVEPEDFPLETLTFTYRESDSLSHRDFLGSFMALGVERDVIGDILVGKGRCVAFVRREMADYFAMNLRKIGRVGVKVTVGPTEDLPLEREFKTISGVVASERLDCLVGLVCRVSREKAAGMITAGLVLVNHREVLSGSQRVSEGDLLSVRKVGKFIIDRLGPQTAKGRLSVQCRKYQ